MSDTTVGKILLRSYLPKSLHDFADKTLDKKSIGDLFLNLSTKHKDEFNHITSHLARFGFDAATRSGSSVSLEDLKSPIDKDKRFDELEKEIEVIKKKHLPTEEETTEILKLYGDFTSKMDKDIISEGLKHDKTLAKIVNAGTRGSVAQYRSTVAAPGLVLDAKEQPFLSFPIKHSFAEGLSLPEYLAASHGARIGEVKKKLCESADTEVFTDTFIKKKIKDLKIGDKIIGADATGNTFVTTVTNIFDNGLRDCYKYIFRKGRSKEFIENICTEEHRFLGKYKKYGSEKKELMPFGALKDYGGKGIIYSAVLPNNFIENDGYKKEYRALYLGLMLGDGWVKKKGQESYVSQFSCADDTLTQDISSYLNSLDLDIKRYSVDSSSHGIWALNKLKEFNVMHPVKSWIKSLGLLGTSAETKFIPDEVWTWNQASLANLISGLISTDGSIIYNKQNNISICFAVVSKNIAYTLKEILEKRFNIYCTPIRATAKEKIKGAINDLYSFQISHRYSVKKFYNSIKLVGKKRIELECAYTKFVENNKCEDYPCSFMKKEHVGRLPTFDIEVDHPDHLYITSNMLIIHNSTASSGFFSKQVSRASTTVIVKEHDCGTDNGISYPVSDMDSIGCFLAHPVDNYKKNNEVTADMLTKLKNNNISSIVVRSPITCQSSRHFHSGAVCQLCVGMRENGLPQLGAYIGILAGAAASEPLTQLQLSAKHQSGTAGANLGGFDLINQLANIPKNFPEAAAIADSDGEISDIKKAGSGGHYVKLNDIEHYIGPGFNVYVKKGDRVEKGDVLSEGIIDPSKIVEYKGIGEGRKHYVDTLYKAFKESGIPVNRRNFELIAKNAIDHVRIIEPEGLGDFLPDQVVSYQALEKNYKPREGSKLIRIDHAKGQYLEAPILHYTIGTPISNSVIKNLKQNNIESITVHSEPPKFEPTMVRLLDVPEHEPDIFHTLYSTYLAKRLSNAVNTGVGASSDIKGPSPILGLSYGVNFGDS